MALMASLNYLKCQQGAHTHYLVVRRGELAEFVAGAEEFDDAPPCNPHWQGRRSSSDIEADPKRSSAGWRRKNGEVY
jgi:hypothetical protein